MYVTIFISYFARRPKNGDRENRQITTTAATLPFAFADVMCTPVGPRRRRELPLFIAQIGNQVFAQSGGRTDPKSLSKLVWVVHT
jgi:hypothetical protein